MKRYDITAYLTDDRYPTWEEDFHPAGDHVSFEEASTVIDALLLALDEIKAIDEKEQSLFHKIVEIRSILNDPKLLQLKDYASE